MKKILSAILSALAVCSLATAALAFEKGVDYIVIEESIPEHYVAYGDAYPSSTTKGLPECTSGELLKGTVITSINENGSHCWSDNLSNNASAAFDGNDETLFDPYDAVKDSWLGVILDDPHELTEIRFKVRDGWKDRSYGATIQGSQDGKKWITVMMFKEEALSDDFIIVTPTANQDYIDAGCEDNSEYWVRPGSYKMYRFVNLKGKHGEVVELELYGNPAPASEVPEGMLPVDSGICGADGDNLKWSLYEDGELVIEGEGAMADWEWDSPWASSASDIIGVTISDKVTSIGENAFSGCSRLESITIPEGVTSIGNTAFTYCSRLKTINLSNTVTTIGEGAFSYCEKLESVTIPESVTSIGHFAFESCTSLTKATILSRNAELGWDLFYDSAERFTLWGYSESTAEAYAAEYECRFVALDVAPETEPPFVGPEGTVNFAEIGEIITSSTNDISAIFDGSLLTGASLGGSGSGSWMGVKLDKPSILTVVALATYDTDGDGMTDAPHRIFKTVVEGSNDGETWEQIMYFGDPYSEYEDFAWDLENGGSNYWTEEAFDGDDSEDQDAKDPVAYKYYRVWNDDGNDFWGEVAFWGTLVEETPAYTPGDINGDGALDINDSITLFQHNMMPDFYPISYEGELDFTKDGAVDIADVIHLFRHIMMPGMYPL